MSYKVLICGCRNYSDFDKILRIMKKAKDVTIISGGAKGADSLAIKVAEILGFEFREYKADWKRFGRSAGPIRNQKMLDIENPDFIIAFHPDIEKSKGTKDMLKRAKKNHIPFKLFS